MGRIHEDPNGLYKCSNEKPQALSNQYPDFVWSPYVGYSFAIATKRWGYDRRKKSLDYVYSALDALGPHQGDEIFLKGINEVRDYSGIDVLYACLNPLNPYVGYALRTPRMDKHFKYSIKKLHSATWSPTRKSWIVSKDDLKKACALFKECYGYDVDVVEVGSVVHRCKDDVSHLLHCYTDLDDIDGTPAEAFAEAHAKLLDAGIPLPNIDHDSGTGIWVIYNLEPVEKTDENIDKWSRFQYYLASVLGSKVDGNVISDYARTCRIAGSRNNKNARVVNDIVCASERYTLDELCACVPDDFDYDPPIKKNTKKVEKLDKIAKNEKEAQAVLEGDSASKEERRLALKALEAAKEERQKIEVPNSLIPYIKDPVLRRYYGWVIRDLVLFCDFEGSGREKHIWGLRYFLRQAGYTDEASLNMVLMVNEILENPLTEDEIISSTGSADYKDCYHFSSKGIRRFFEISDQEMPYIGMKTCEEKAERDRFRHKKAYEDKLLKDGKTTKEVAIYRDLTQIKALLNEGKDVSDICQILGMKKSTAYNRINALKNGDLDIFSKKFSAYIEEREAEEEEGQLKGATPTATASSPPEHTLPQPVLLPVQDFFSTWKNDMPLYKASPAELIDTIRFHVERLSHQNLPISSSLTLERVHEILKDDKLDDFQENAILDCLSHGITALTGKWGTGKSTVINGIIKVFKALYPMKNVVVMAPTGTAAQNVIDKTGTEASTLHSRLRITWDFDDDAESFASRIKNSLVVVDEASMIDNRVMTTLLSKCESEDIGPGWHNYGCTVVLVGDPLQLEAVDEGSPYRAMVEQHAVHIVELTREYRTATESYAIDDFASAVRSVDETGEFTWNGYESGHGLDIRAYDRSASERSIENELVKQAVENVAQYGIAHSIVLCPENWHPYGVVSINKRLQAELNPNDGESFPTKYGLVIRKGDPVMNTVNTSLGKGKKKLANGCIGTCVDVSNGTATCEFVVGGETITYAYSDNNAKDITLAYAISIHKSQGHEWDAVVFALFARQKHFLSRRILCTALTRARKSVTLFCDPDGLKGAIQGLADRGESNENSVA